MPDDLSQNVVATINDHSPAHGSAANCEQSFRCSSSHLAEDFECEDHYHEAVAEACEPTGPEPELALIEEPPTSPHEEIEQRQAPSAAAAKPGVRDAWSVSPVLLAAADPDVDVDASGDFVLPGDGNSPHAADSSQQHMLRGDQPSPSASPSPTATPLAAMERWNGSIQRWVSVAGTALMDSVHGTLQHPADLATATATSSSVCPRTPAEDEEKERTFTQSTFPGALIGEEHLSSFYCNLHSVNGLVVSLTGEFILTNYRLIFRPQVCLDRRELRWMHSAELFNVALGTIEDVMKVNALEWLSRPNPQKVSRVKVVTKDLRCLVFLIDQSEDAQSLVSKLQKLLSPGPDGAFAFSHATHSWAEKGLTPPGRDLCYYDPVEEYARMDVHSAARPNHRSPWELKKFNENYKLCSSYPEWLVLPKQVDEQDLAAIAQCRRHGRIPTLTWCAGAKFQYAAIWRCSQPMDGIRGGGSPDDERLLKAIGEVGQPPDACRRLLVLDLRTQSVAWVNKAGGGGFESYDCIKLIFGGLENVHRVRDSWRAMGIAVQSINQSASGSWMRDVADSKWYDMIGVILEAMQITVKQIQQKRSLLIHCSDGWDRTSQVASLAQLCLDPFARTRLGFLRLIQRDFCSFGHPFKTRLALVDKMSSAFSPIFIQWLECVYQIMEQFPSAFEFRSSLLLVLATEVMTNQYGSFLFDCEEERVKQVAPRSLSLWEKLMEEEEIRATRNESYRPVEKTIKPVVCQVRTKIWENYWLRFHPIGSGSPMQSAAARERICSSDVEEYCFGASGQTDDFGSCASDPESEGPCTETTATTSATAAAPAALVDDGDEGMEQDALGGGLGSSPEARPEAIPLPPAPLHRSSSRPGREKAETRRDAWHVVPPCGGGS
mmetsp:Transcript_16135/g.34877  ORF Transcript_16135/g.34877 Transcript_16135/m.34877 type:complete len:889 (-) Transcript_16135:198-2864(-)